MKKIFILFIAAIMLIGLTACGESAPSNTPESGREASAPESAATETDESAAEFSKDAESVSQETDGSQEGEQANNKVLVVVFSATGTTKGVAEKIAAIEGADIYEIKAKQEYTSADLNWNDRNSRSTKEQTTAPSARRSAANVYRSTDTIRSISASPSGGARSRV